MTSIKRAPTHGQTGSRPAETAIEKCPTGIAGFDEITGGGLPKSRTSLILGAPGAGKTVFALECLVNGANNHREPAIFVAFEENSRQIMSNAATFGWDLPALERDKLFFLDARLSPTVVQAGDFDLTAMLAGLEAKAKEMNAKRIVFDGIDILISLLDDPAKERQELYRLQDWLHRTGLTAIITAKSYEGDRVSSERYAFMQFMVDAVVMLYHRMLDRVSLRGLRVLKYRGTGFAENEFPLVISPTGIEVSVFGQSELTYDVSTDRIPTGVPRLDTMLDGGYYRGSGILISGAPGTAKTTLSGAFVEAGCRRGESALFVSFDEAASQITRNLRSVGIDLQPHCDSGLLHMYSIRTEARSSEEHFLELRGLMKRLNPKNVVLDPISALTKTGGHVSAVHASLRLLDYARSLGITVLCTSLVASEDAFHETTSMQISTIADTWIHLAYMVRNGERNRTLTVVKSRGMGHSNQVRELILARNGITLTDVYTAGGEVLLGTARWEYEARMRDEALRIEAERQQRRRELEHQQAELDSRIEALLRERNLKRAELESFAGTTTAAGARRQSNAEEIRKLRHADADTHMRPDRKRDGKNDGAHGDGRG
jgi:circadian clock protein KaiC